MLTGAYNTIGSNEFCKVWIYCFRSSHRHGYGNGMTFDCRIVAYSEFTYTLAKKKLP